MLKFWFDQAIRISFSIVNYIYLLGLCIEEYKEIMSQQFHLYTCIFRIHGFNTKFLGTDNLHFFIFIIILVQICLLEIAC